MKEALGEGRRADGPFPGVSFFAALLLAIAAGICRAEAVEAPPILQCTNNATSSCSKAINHKIKFRSLHKNFQEDHLNSRRFPGFPGVVDTLIYTLTVRLIIFMIYLPNVQCVVY